MSSPLPWLTPAIHNTDRFAQNPPPARYGPISGYAVANMLGSSKDTESQDKAPVDFISNRWNNVPDRFELFLLGDDEKKVTITPETRVPNACVFLFKKEDHTLGNLLRHRLLQSPQVLFAAYKIPHPLFADFELRVQTDGSLTPKEALLRACRDIVQDLGVLSREFTKEWELKKISRMHAEDGMGGL